jgi:predicted CXXCH cytochrome family protein
VRERKGQIVKGEPIMNEQNWKIMGPIALGGLLLLIPSSAFSQETMAGYLLEEYSCVMCHTDMRTDFLEGVHSDRGIQCTDCHGGDPTQFETETAHSNGFRSALTKAQSVELCLSCHGDIPEMRQYALEPVTRDEFLISRHGQSLLVEGNLQAPACSDCHGSHAIYPMVDPRSPIHPTRISETCAECHSNPARVPDGYPTDQFSDWIESAHGKALTEELNNRSANCASCHGSHSALPPGVREIPNVCGKCHQLVRQAYFSGPHATLNSSVAGTGGCLGCHANHATEMPPLSAVGAICLGCHEEDSPAGVMGLQIQEQILRAEAAGDRAHQATHMMIRSGERTEDLQIRLQMVDTHLQALLVQAHSLDPSLIDELSRRISSLSHEIVERGDVVEEHRWERKLLVIPLWILALSAVLLALRKRRLVLALQAAVEGETAPGPEAGA